MTATFLQFPGFGGGSGSNSFQVVVEPTGTIADATNIVTAAGAVNSAGGGDVQLIEGSYNLNQGIDLDTLSNVTIKGIGPGTILTAVGPNSSAVMINMHGTAVTVDEPTDNISIGATSITITTHATAASILSGMALFIVGIESSSGLRDGFCCHATANGNGTTGVVTIDIPAPMALTGVLTDSILGNKNMILSDFSMIPTGTWSHIVLNRYSDNTLISNLSLNCSGITAADDGITLVGCCTPSIEKCSVYKLDGSGIFVGASLNFNVLRNQISYCNTSNTGARSPMRIALSTYQGIVEGNVLTSNKGDAAIHFDEGASQSSIGRILCQGNQISYQITGVGIEMEGHGIIATNNIIQNVIANVGIRAIDLGDRCMIIGNHINNCLGGIGTNNSSSNDTLIANNEIKKCTGTHGIFVAAPKVVVVNNRIDTTTDNCISIHNATDCVVNGNICDNATFDGIRLYEVSTKTNVTGNLCRSNGRDGIRIDGVDASNPADCSINANTCLSNTGAGVGIYATKRSMVNGNRCANNDKGLVIANSGTGTTDNCLFSLNHLQNNTTTNLDNTTTGAGNDLVSNKT